MKFRKYLLLTIISLSFLGLLIVSNNQIAVVAQDDDTLADILAQGYMTVGSDTIYPPFEEINSITSFPQGFDVDLAILIADNLRVDLVFKTSAWEPIIPNLKAAQFDMIISGMIITPTREAEVDFTRYYYVSSQAWMVQTGNPESVLVEADLNMTGLNVAFQNGTTSHLYFNDNLQASSANVFAEVPIAIDALKLGTVDVVLGDWALLLDAAAGAPTDIEVIGTFSSEEFGIAVRDGQTALRTRLNTILDGLLGNDEANSDPSDTYNAIYFQAFGSNAPGYTGTVTSTGLPVVNLYTDVADRPAPSTAISTDTSTDTSNGTFTSENPLTDLVFTVLQYSTGVFAGVSGGILLGAVAIFISRRR